jgi:hypothetical protein
MRQPADAMRIQAVLDHLGRSTSTSLRIYLAGGATAVLHGWRPTTIDVDLKLVPDSDELLRAIPRLKEELEVNLELAAPDQFIPPLPGWEERSLFIRQVGSVAFYHYDPYGQALAKIERGHPLDLDDACRMVREGLVETDRLLQLFAAIEPQLYRYPAVDPRSFRRAVEDFTGGSPTVKDA